MKKGMTFLLALLLILSPILFSSCSAAGSSQSSAPAGTGPRDLTYSPDGKGYTYKQDGWHYLHIEGGAYERGYQHGFLLGDYIGAAIASMKELTYIKNGVEWSYFKDNASRLWKDKLDAEQTAELEGIVAGAAAAGQDFDFADLLTWNGYEEITEYWFPTVAADYYKSLGDGQDETNKDFGPDAGDHCSAFIATGSYTDDGRIVVAHNSFFPFEVGVYLNVIIDLAPEEGSHFVMQSQPGYIHSFSDYYSSEYLIVTETTIDNFSVYDAGGIPEFIRIRRAVQYAKTLDEFVEYMQRGNNGGYANTWLVGDLSTNEIMRFEQGLKFFAIDKTTDGAYAGFNLPLDPRIRNFETSNSPFADIRRHHGARRVRIPQLLEEHKGRIDVGSAQQIIADHYDMYLKKDNPCSRTVCCHYELDALEYIYTSAPPYWPMGAVDGVVGTSGTAAEFSLYGRWGSSCGMEFDAEEFLKEHPQYLYLEKFLADRPSQPWSLLKPAA